MKYEITFHIQYSEWESGIVDGIIESNHIEIKNGCLIFYSKNGRVINAYAPGGWNSVKEMEAQDETA